MRVRIREAEKPDQNPRRPFSAWIWRAISFVEAEDSFDSEESSEKTRADVCFLVTILAIGVVISFANEPAKKPTVSSSRTGRVFDFEPLVFILLSLRKLYARKKRKASATVLLVSWRTPV